MDLEAFRQAAAALYSSALPYHNFNHAMAVAGVADNIVGRCRSEGVPVNGDAVHLAALFHDAGFHEDHARLGYRTKEAYSAELARREMMRLGLVPEFIELVCDAILSTHCDGVCRSNESKAVRAADLAGLAAEYPVFKRNSVRLKLEHEMLSQARIPWVEWRGLAADRVELFLRQDLDLTRDYFDVQGRSVFHLRVRENLRRLREDPAETVPEGEEIACL